MLPPTANDIRITRLSELGVQPTMDSMLGFIWKQDWFMELNHGTIKLHRKLTGTANPVVVKSWFVSTPSLPVQYIAQAIIEMWDIEHPKQAEKPKAEPTEPWTPKVGEWVITKRGKIGKVTTGPFYGTYVYVTFPGRSGEAGVEIAAISHFDKKLLKGKP